MKHAIVILFSACIGLTTLHSAPDEETSNAKFATANPSGGGPDAGGVLIEPSEGQIAPGTELTITFPSAMVSADKIDLSEQPSPFVSKPKIEGNFLWKSQTEGVFVVKSVVAGAKHRLTLARDLKDVSGKSVVAPGWSAEFTATPFTISSDFSEREQLNRQPQIPLETSYNVRLTEVAGHVYFQDRDSRQRFPVDVILRSDEKPTEELEAEDFRVEPRQPLPVGRTYDLIVNGLLDAKSRRPLPYLKVIPVGKTEPLKVEWIAAFNHALDEPVIRIKFNDDIDPAEATPDRIRIEPAVKEMRLLASRDEVEVHGQFDLTQRYRVTVSPELKGERGYGLATESRWGATFHPKESTIVFPASQIFLRARPELRFSFFQVNTPPVTWKLARIPLEKLPAVTARVREFDKNATDPITGEDVVDPRTGFKKQFQTELLVQAFNLPVVTSGTVEAATGDTETRRDVRCAGPNGEPLVGIYLFEASAQLGDGRIVGNRSIVCSSDFILTQKRTPATALIRVTKMSDAQPVGGVTIRAVTNENIELARGGTDANGLATFSLKKIFPHKKLGAHLFIADTKSGPALQFVEGTTYSSGYPGGPGGKIPHAEIITDRNLYRPGQVVKMKGIVRNFTGGGLTIPSGGEAHWRVLGSDGARVVGEGSATVSPDGAWEAEWTVPEKSKLGHFGISCTIDNRQYDGVASIDVEEYRVPLFSVVVEAEAEVGQTAHARVSSAYFHGAPNVGARVHWKATWTAVADSGSEADGYKRRYNAYPEVGPSLDPYSEETKTIEGDAKLDARGFADLVCESPFKENPAIGRANVSWRAEITSLDGQTIVGGEMASIFSNSTRLGIRATERPGKDGGVNVNLDAVDKEDAKIAGVPVRVDLFHVTTKTTREQIAPFVFRYRNTDQFAKVASQETKTPAEFLFPADKTGRYVVTASAPDRKTALVGDEATFTGEEPAELPVQSETSFKIEHRPEAFTPGEKAVLTIQAPFGGMAWVSVETDAILETLLVPLSGNAGRIELPIKKDYAPNATVSIYLVRPGGDKELPQERFAVSEIEVRRPDRELTIEPHLAKTSVKPGESIHGELRITSEGKPVGDVDLVVFAVDDAVLKLGDWKLPNLLAGFYPRNPFAVRSYQSLQNYIQEITQKSLTQKGFVIGDGGEEPLSNVTNLRKEFRTLAFWEGSLKTGPDGKATFDFTAPDNLTTYRVVAIGQTKANQFGGDASATVQVS
ncbi:MAG TPA: MG2 domain-containing protein, partial [Candidatus Baltobacteraceae bacterium]|nr:MG2 domain-containing protein [Candidatus Baltobacteraceae bacterium]